MAVVAKFVADFSSFTTALDRAQLEMRNFDREVGRVDQSLAKFGDQFSGRKVFTDAALATKAVQELGGAATLTTKEQVRLNAILVDAIDKYAVLGKTAPRAMLDLERATRDAAQSTQQASGWWGDLGKSVLGTMTGFLSAQVILGTIKTAVGALRDQIVQLTLGGAAVADVSDNFERLTTQAGLLGSQLLGALRAGTHATVSDLDLMKSVNQGLAAGFALTTEKAALLARGAFALAQATGGDVKTAFDALNDAMLTGQTRAIALLTGRINLEAAEAKYAASLGLTRKDLDETQQLEAKREGILDAVARATARLGEQTDGLDEKVQQAKVAWANFQNELGKAINQSPVMVAAIDEIGKILERTFGGDMQTLVKILARAFDEALIAMVEFGRAAVSAAGFAAKEWFAVQKVFGNVAQVIDGVVLATLYLEKAQLAVGHVLGLNEAAWKRNDKAIEDTMIRMLRRGEALQAHTAAQRQVDDATKAFDSTLASLKARMESARVTTETKTAAVEKLTQTTTRVVAATQAYTKESELASSSTQRWMSATRGLASAMESMQASATVAALTVTDVADAFGDAQQAVESFARSADAALDKTATKAASAASVLGGTFSLQNPYALSGQMSADEQARRAAELGGIVAKDSYGNPYVHVPGKNLPGSGTLFGRALGGPVSKGRPYLVGERGPELFVPSTTGSIAAGVGAGLSVTIHVDARESLFDTASGMNRLAERVGAALIAQMRGRGMAVAAVGG